MKIRGYKCHTLHSLNRENGSITETRHVEFWTQPLWSWLISRAYHWYDMRIYKVPGFKLLEKWLWKRHEDELFYMPLGCQQDLRCYHLSEKNRTILANIPVTEEIYQAIKRRP